MSNEPSVGERFSPFGFLLQPGREFGKLIAAPHFIAPLLTLVIGSIAIELAYFSRLDLDWFKATLATNPLVARSGGANVAIGRNALLFSAVVGATLPVVSAWLFTAGYVRFLAAALDRAFTFRDALALSAWAIVPHVIGLLPVAANLALHFDGRLTPDQLDPTTLAALLGLPGTTFVGNVAQQVDLFGLWSWGLVAIGLHELLRLRWWKSIALVAAPLGVLLGVRATIMSLMVG